MPLSHALLECAVEGGEVGFGKRMFKEDAAGTGLTLIDYRKVGPDVVLLTYRQAAAKPDQAAS